VATSGNIRFGDYVLNRARGCLEHATGAGCFLRPKSYRVLEVLAERRDQLVSKDDLVLEVWPDVIVSDDSLAHCVSDIRRALGPEGADLLRTVPRRGYMLTAGGQASAVSASRPPRSRRLLSGGAVVAIVVVAVAVAVGVGWRHPPTGLDPSRGADLPALIQADALLDARDWQRREDNEKARTLIEAVLAGDPDNAAAWASLGLTYWLEVRHLAWGGGRREMTQALGMVERAVALGGSARAHRLLAEMRLLAPFAEMRSPLDALASARAAVEIAPGDPDNLIVLAHALALTGQAQEAVRMIEEARHRASDSPDWYREVAGLGYLLAGQPARAVEELGPLHGSATYTGARWWPGWLFAASLAHAGRIDDAKRVVDGARRHQPEASIAGVTQSLDGLSDAAGRAVVLDGLRLAGMPG